jgi:hypothetical protein
LLEHVEIAFAGFGERFLVLCVGSEPRVVDLSNEERVISGAG